MFNTYRFIQSPLLFLYIRYIIKPNYIINILTIFIMNEETKNAGESLDLKMFADRLVEEKKL